ncbi:MAG TPA: hypothetical protein VF829_00210 [Candidatus Paceibacterota bacterium]
MSRAPRFEWNAKEHEFDDKPAEWYWGLGIVAASGVIASILFGNYLLALVLITAAFAIALQAAKEPRAHYIALSEDGLIIEHRLYPFDLMRSFSMLEYIDAAKPPVLSIKTHSLLAPHLMIPLDGVDADAVYAFMFAYVEEDEHRETFVDHLMRLLRL